MKMGSIDPSGRLPQTGRLGAGRGRRTGFTGTGNGEFKRLALITTLIKEHTSMWKLGRGNAQRNGL